METLVEGSPSHRPPTVGLPSPVQFRHRTPVKGASNNVGSLLGVRWVVPPRLHDVYFPILYQLRVAFEWRSYTSPALWPDTVGVVHWKHPDRGPKPVASRSISTKKRRGTY